MVFHATLAASHASLVSLLRCFFFSQSPSLSFSIKFSSECHLFFFYISVTRYVRRILIVVWLVISKYATALNTPLFRRLNELLKRFLKKLDDLVPAMTGITTSKHRDWSGCKTTSEQCTLLELSFFHAATVTFVSITILHSWTGCSKDGADQKHLTVLCYGRRKCINLSLRL